jgi:hypothetical protein
MDATPMTARDGLADNREQERPRRRINPRLVAIAVEPRPFHVVRHDAEVAGRAELAADHARHAWM